MTQTPSSIPARLIPLEVPTAGVSLFHVCKTFGAVTVIPDVDLVVEPGEFIVFVGPSGCGKSTLLRCIAGLETIDSGRIYLGERRIDQLDPGDRGLAMVFQSYALYPHMTARKNLSFCLETAGWKRAAIDKRVDEVASMLKIDHLLEKKPATMSGGQRQRVAIGRAIVRKSDVFLFDEPLSNLDAALRVHMRLELARLHREFRITTIYVTHDQVEAMTLADRIVVLNKGVIEQVGTPHELYHRPANSFVAGFLGSPRINLVAIEDVSSKPGGYTLSLSGACRPIFLQGVLESQALSGGEIGIRPEHLSLCDPDEGDFNGTVALVEMLGGATIVHVDRGAREMMAVLTGSERSVEIGTRVGLAIDGKRMLLFNREGLRVAL